MRENECRERFLHLFVQYWTRFVNSADNLRRKKTPPLIRRHNPQPHRIMTDPNQPQPDMDSIIVDPKNMQELTIYVSIRDTSIAVLSLYKHYVYLK